MRVPGEQRLNLFTDLTKIDNMKKCLLTAAVALVALPGFAGVVDDICYRNGSAPAYMVATGDYGYQSLPVCLTGNIKVEKVDANTIRIYNFLEMFDYLDFTVNGNTITLKTTEARTNYGSNVLLVPGKIVGPIYDYDYNPSYPWYMNMDNGEVFSGTITKRGDNAYSILFNNLYVYDDTVFANNYQGNLFQMIQVVTFDTNGHITDKVTEMGTTTERNYDIIFNFKEDGKIEIVNFANNGNMLRLDQNASPIQPYFTIAQGTLLSGGSNGVRKFTMDAAPIAISLASKCITAKNYNYEWLEYVPVAPDIYPISVGKYVSASNYKGNLTGTLTFKVPAHNEDETAIAWTGKDGGARKTLCVIEGEMDPYALWCNTSNSELHIVNGIYQKVDQTKIVFDKTYEITHEADIELTKSEYVQGEGLNLAGRAYSVKNSDFVNNFDLYLVKGNHTSVAGNEAFSNTEKGHNDAIALGEYAVTTQAGDADVNFNVTLPLSKIAEIDPEGEGKYTVYVKANYKPETGLAPTFHALTPVTADVMTGVGETFATEAAITAAKGMINVANYNGIVEVYNAQGALIYSGNANEIPVAAGIYMVKAGSINAKVLVK